MLVLTRAFPFVMCNLQYAASWMSRTVGMNIDLVRMPVDNNMACRPGLRSILYLLAVQF